MDILINIIIIYSVIYLLLLFITIYYLFIINLL